MRRIPPKSSSRRDKRNEGRNCGIFGEGGTKWKVAATSLHDDVLLDTEEYHEETPIALMQTVIRWWEALRAPEVAKWQQKSRVDWDAADGRNGGAQRRVWDMLVEVKI